MALRSSAYPKWRPRRLSLSLAGIAATALLAVSGCSVLNGSSGSSDSSSSGSGNLEKTSISVAVQPFVDAAPAYIAQQKGYFKQEGLNVKLVSLPSSTVIIPKLISGDVDVAEGNFGSAITAEYNKTGDFKFIAYATTGKPGAVQVLALPSSGINSAKDLAGKTIGTNTLKDVLYDALAATLEANNVPLTSVHMTVVPHPQVPEAIGTHQVDAGVLVEPYRTQAARTYGARPVVDLFSGPTANLPYNAYYVNSAFAKKYPNTVNAFLRALWKGAEDATANRKDVEQILPTYTNVDAATAALMALPNYPTGLSKAQVQRVADLSTKFGLIGGHFDVTPMIYSYTPPASNGG